MRLSCISREDDRNVIMDVLKAECCEDILEMAHKLFGRLDKITRGKIVFFISHRLINIGLVEQIVVLDYGRIIESRMQEELLVVNGQYTELFLLPAGVLWGWELEERPTIKSQVDN